MRTAGESSELDRPDGVAEVDSGDEVGAFGEVNEVEGADGVGEFDEVGEVVDIGEF